MKLPVSGMDVVFRAPDGTDDLALLESAGGPMEHALVALERLARVAGRESDRALWAALTVTDFEAALLGLRRFLLGDTVACVFRCTQENCGERMAPDFSIAAFLADVNPRVPRKVESSEDRPGWFALSANGDGKVWFRLPAVEDQLEVMGRPRARDLLMQRCVDAGKLKARGLGRVEHAMETMAPLVSRPLAGNCPECGAPVTMPMHVPRLVMDEIKASAAGVHEEIHTIAAAYHWDEATILAMPQSRRQMYTETIRLHERPAL